MGGATQGTGNITKLFGKVHQRAGAGAKLPGRVAVWNAFSRNVAKGGNPFDIEIPLFFKKTISGSRFVATVVKGGMLGLTVPIAMLPLEDRVNRLLRDTI